ncbi:MarR family winged helix-turn-helix transcriptional regulator [Kitasatospora kifunensis]|uniref:DNA-binding MarR family transcriptional regulator n=1 Tax=Kitasatospora kifunensis TaxID=58351 RepID=A0A7W7QWW7_KITKI|nr:MarR family transcriptional regulator [Kitasatospora kifunensis]MBB4921291.1 DNA-binding MarR family transcriptional regulator [Kitasatospora kifunensis]
MDVISNTTEPLSGDELALWHACKTLGTVVTQRVGAALTAATGLSGTDYGVISRLADLGAGRLGQQTLTDSMGLTKGAMSHQLTRMTHRGLVLREKTGTGSTVILTDHGRTLLSQARPVHATAVREQLLDRLSADERATLLRIAARLAE